MSALSYVEEVSHEDYAAVEKVLRQIDTDNPRRASLETLANWKLGFKLFRDLELSFERLVDRSEYQHAHRALLTSLLAMTEALQLKVTSLDEADLRRISLSKETFAGCLKYIRQKYNQWFAPVDPTIARLFETRMAEK
jgi:hypothetical protein